MEEGRREGEGRREKREGEIEKGEGSRETGMLLAWAVAEGYWCYCFLILF
jgi:hypothetical protein